MPRRIVPLTDQQVKQAEPADKPWKLFDGYGLYVLILPTGTKTWRMKFRHADGKDKSVTFGRYPDVSLALARCRRSVARQMLHDGLDPRTEFSPDNMSWPKGNSPAERQAERSRNQAVKKSVARLRTLVSLLFWRVPINEQKRTNMLVILERIQNERSADVVDVLYDVCAEIIFGCLSVGIDELIEVRLGAAAEITQLSAGQG